MCWSLCLGYSWNCINLWSCLCLCLQLLFLFLCLFSFCNHFLFNNLIFIQIWFHFYLLFDCIFIGYIILFVFWINNTSLFSLWFYILLFLYWLIVVLFFKCFMILIFFWLNRICKGLNLRLRFGCLQWYLILGCLVSESLIYLLFNIYGLLCLMMLLNFYIRHVIDFV